MSTEADTILSYESISNAVTAYFKDVKHEYPGYNPSFMCMDYGRIPSRGHITCTISPILPILFSPRYPDAIKVTIKNEWEFPYSAHSDSAPPTERADSAPPTERADVVVVLPGSQSFSILEDAKVDSLQRVSDLRKCLAYLFATDAIALGEITRTLRVFNEKKDAAELLKKSQSEVRNVVRVRTKQFLGQLKSDISILRLSIAKSDGSNQELTVAQACGELDLKLDRVIYDALVEQARTLLQSVYPQVEAMVDRLLIIK